MDLRILEELCSCQSEPQEHIIPMGKEVYDYINQLNQMEENKNNIAVKLTRKNWKNVFDILKMFGEPIKHNFRTHLEHSENGMVLHFSRHFGEWLSISTDILKEKTLVKRRRLRNILAQEHLKSGEAIVCKNNGSPTEFITKFLRADNDGLFVGIDYHVINEGGLSNGNKSYFNNFLRYATEEEKAALNGEAEEKKEFLVSIGGGPYVPYNGEYLPVNMDIHIKTKEYIKKAANLEKAADAATHKEVIKDLTGEEPEKKELKTGVWYKSLRLKDTLVLRSGDKENYGFIHGDWKESIFCSSPKSWEEADTGTVTEALIREAKKRGLVKGAKVLPVVLGAAIPSLSFTLAGKFIYNRCELQAYTQRGSRIVVFRDGKWAEPVVETKEDNLIDTLRANPPEEKKDEYPGATHDFLKHAAELRAIHIIAGHPTKEHEKTDIFFDQPWGLLIPCGHGAPIRPTLTSRFLGDKPKSLKIEKGKRYRCVKDLSLGAGWGESWFNATGTYLSEKDGYLTDERGCSCNIGEFTDWFKEVEKQKVEKEVWVATYPGGGNSVYFEEPVVRPGRIVRKGTLTYEV